MLQAVERRVKRNKLSKEDGPMASQNDSQEIEALRRELEEAKVRIAAMLRIMSLKHGR